MERGHHVKIGDAGELGLFASVDIKFVEGFDMVVVNRRGLFKY